MIESTIVRPGAPAWTDALRHCAHDVYHLPGYVALEAQRHGGEPLAFVARAGESVFLQPLIVRAAFADGGEAFAGVKDAVSPYGYPCPVVSRVDDTDFHGVAVERLIESLRGMGCCSALVRLHPLLEPPRGALVSAGHLVTHGQTVWIDLTLPREELWRQTRLSDRNRINKLRRTGHEARIDEDLERFDRFVEIYLETMRRVGADRSYWFDARYFSALSEALAGHLHLCVVELDGEVTAAGLFTECDGMVQFHLSGTAVEHLRAAPTRLMLDFVRSWAKSRGNTRFHLGGGLGARSDSLFEFKAGFSKLRADFSTWRVVCEPKAYDAAVREWERRTNRSRDDAGDFFPVYRTPPREEG